MSNNETFVLRTGKKKIFRVDIIGCVFAVFLRSLFHMLTLSFAGDYEYPDAIPHTFSLKWWDYILSKGQMVESIGTSLVLAIVVTVVSLLICLPAAYAIARYSFKGRGMVRLSFLLTNAFPKMGIYTAMAVIFYKLNLMGTFVE